MKSKTGRAYAEGVSQPTGHVAAGTVSEPVSSPNSERRILFLQYTNPAAYPPLEHASRLLAEAGWNVRFLGAELQPDDKRRLPPHERIELRFLPSFGGGVAQKLNFASYIAWAVNVARRWRPDWIYASDQFSAPAALLAKRASGCRVVYHEHDAPSYDRDVSKFLGAIRTARGKIARTAELCIIPQPKRLENFVESTARVGPSLCVLNCPRHDEAGRPRPAASERLGFYYHGNLSEKMLPPSILTGLATLPRDSFSLTIVGYETVGSEGFMRRFLEAARHLGIGDNVTYRGILDRQSMLDVAASHGDVGLALMETDRNNLNFRYLAGASNKPFDYLAVGQMLLVPDLPEWREMFVDAGFARACNPADPVSIAAAMRWCIENRDAVRAMGERGRKAIVDRWNYEAEFAKVLGALEAIVDY